jgi:hypothetical protein
MVPRIPADMTTLTRRRQRRMMARITAVQSPDLGSVSFPAK